MKIPDSPYHFGNEPVLPGSPPSRERMFDDADLRFLEMLTGMNRATAEKILQGQVSVSVPDSPKPEKTGKSSEAALLPVSTKMDQARVELAKLHEELSRVNVQKDLEILNGDLTDADVQFLQQVLVAGLPYQGGVPVSRLMTLDGQGRPVFEGLEVSKGLSDLLEKAWKTGRSLRVDMNAQSSVILRFHQGKVSAEFLTQDQAMALFLKQSMEDLRQRLEARSLPVGTLSAREEPDPRQQGRNESDEQSKTEG